MLPLPYVLLLGVLEVGVREFANAAQQGTSPMQPMCVNQTSTLHKPPHYQPPHVHTRGAVRLRASRSAFCRRFSIPPIISEDHSRVVSHVMVVRVRGTFLLLQEFFVQAVPNDCFGLNLEWRRDVKHHLQHRHQHRHRRSKPR
jgi:hypothetical protein